MTFLELAKKRYSVRKYKNIPVEEDKLQQVLEAGRVAPSAVNFQPLHFIVFREEEMRKKVADTYEIGAWIYEAPVIIMICGDHSKAWRRPDGKGHCDIDAAIAADHMTLAAAELGLGTCWVCNFDTRVLHKLLRLPPHVEAIVLLPLGYPADQGDPGRHETKRKKMEEIVHWDTFNR
jgi:nitroreductase